MSNVHVARLFLATRAELSDLGLEALAGKDVLAFVLDECRRRSAGSAKYVVTGLRSFLRFLPFPRQRTRAPGPSSRSSSFRPVSSLTRRPV